MPQQKRVERQSIRREAPGFSLGPARAHGGKTSPPAAFKNQSVIRAFAILKSFYSPEEWVAASELSRRARIHEATVNRFMQSLMDVGAVVRDESGKYRCVLFVMPGTSNGSFLKSHEHRPESRTLTRSLL